jgi:hypothetical protein
MTSFVVAIAIIILGKVDSVNGAELLATTTNQAALGEAAIMVSKLSQAIEKGDLEAAALQQLQLRGKGTNALTAINAALAEANPKVRMSLIGALAGIQGDTAAEALLKIAIDDEDTAVANFAAGSLEKRLIPRALASNELANVIARMRNCDPFTAVRWASLLARVRDAQPSDAALRIGAIVDRYEAETTNAASFRASGSYLSSQAFKLNAFLMVMPHMDASNAVSIVKRHHAQTVDPTVRKWLLFARGMCRDQTVIEELRQFVSDSEEDVSERALALKAYALAAGTNAIPFLESLIENTEVGYVPGHPPSELGDQVTTRPLQSVARGELNWLIYPELRLKHRGY